MLFHTNRNKHEYGLFDPKMGKSLHWERNVPSRCSQTDGDPF